MAEMLELPRPAGMTVGAVVRTIAEMLAGAGVPESVREARDIVAALTDRERFWPSLHREDPADPPLIRRAVAAAAKRAAGAPFAYAVGRAAFRHLTLAVDERVLIPRQETELLVEHVLRLAPRRATVADIGTGSGAIALALASEGDVAHVIATDISRDALAVARHNVERLTPLLRAPVELRHGSLLSPIHERLDLIVSNPPYIALPEAAALPRAVRDWEPSVALFGGGDGMRAIECLVRRAPHALVPGGLLALEIDVRRAEGVARLARGTGAFDEVRILPDMTGRDRFLVARLAAPSEQLVHQ